MGSGQPSHEGFGEEGNQACRVSDPTSALGVGAVSSPFQGVEPMGTRFSTSPPPALTAQHPVLSLLRERGAADCAFHWNAGGSWASRRQ